jgi:hypothetical protein
MRTRGEYLPELSLHGFS